MTTKRKLRINMEKFFSCITALFSGLLLEAEKKKRTKTTIESCKKTIQSDMLCIKEKEKQIYIYNL